MDQHLNFVSDKWADYTMCNDMFLIQTVVGLLNNSSQIYNTLIRKFNNTLPHLQIFNTSKLVEDEDKRVILEEEFVRLVILIYSNRIYSASMSKQDICRKFLLHHLFVNGKSKYSHISESVPKPFRAECDLKSIVNEVAIYHKPKGSHEEGYFIVREKFWDELDPYFIVMSQQSLFQAIEQYKSLTNNKTLPPLLLEKPLFLPNEQLEKGINNLIFSPYLFKIMFLVMHRNLLWKKDTQEQLPSYILHALLIILNSMPTGVESNYNMPQPAKKTLFSQLKSFMDVPFKENDSPLKYVMQVIETDDGTEHSILSMLFEFESQRDLVEKILNRLSELNETCDKIILDHGSKQKALSNNEEKEAKKKRAMEKRMKVLEQMKKSQQKFAMNLEEDEETVENHDQLKCAFCHDHKSPEGNDALSLLCQVVKNPIVRVTNTCNLKDTYPSDHELVVVDIGELTEMYSDINRDQNVQINYCSHACHADCFDRYYTNLLQEESRRRRYKGFGQLNLDNMEIFCPVCNRVANCLCPIIPNEFNLLEKLPSEVNQEPLANLDEITNILRDCRIKEITNDSVGQTMTTFCEKIIKKKKEEMEEDEVILEAFDRNDSSYFSNTLSAEIAAEDILQRSLNPNSVVPIAENRKKGMKHLLDILIAFQSLEGNTRKTKQQLDAIYGTVMGLETVSNAKLFNEVERSNVMFLPMLSCDMFTLFVRSTTLLLSTDKGLDWVSYQKLLTIFYFAHVIQCYLQENIRNESPSEVEYLNKGINSIRDMIDFGVTNAGSVKAKLEDLVLTFLRRAVFYTSLLFDVHIPEENEDEFKSLTSYLSLPSAVDACLNLAEPSHTELVGRWFSQLKSSFKSFNSAMNALKDEDAEQEYLLDLSSDSMIQYPAVCKPFTFMSLPNKYEDIVMKYHNTQCKKCNKKIESPALCLLTGRLVWLRNCQCSLDRVGKCTRYANKNFSGFGLFLVIPSSRILLLHENRYCMLPSPYLDANGEEDKKLRRGVPLYLHKERLDELIPTLATMSWDHNTIILESTSNLNANTL